MFRLSYRGVTPEGVTPEGVILDLLIEMKAADRYFLETGYQWQDLDFVQQKKLIEVEKEQLK
jgi:hypothetical protein